MSQQGYIGRWRLDEWGVIKQRRTEGRKEGKVRKAKKEFALNEEKMAREEPRREKENERDEEKDRNREASPSILHAGRRL